MISIIDDVETNKVETYDVQHRPLPNSLLQGGRDWQSSEEQGLYPLVPLS